VSNFEQAAILIAIMMSGYPAQGETTMDRTIRLKNNGLQHFGMMVALTAADLSHGSLPTR
jgi:hypothetical protein